MSEQGGTTVDSLQEKPPGGAPSATPKALYKRLRPGPHGSERNHEQVLRHQRARLTGAMVEAAAQRGYPAISVQQLVTLAGVSKRSFYEHFKGKEDCFLATFDTLAAQAAASLRTAAGRQPPGKEAVRALVRQALDDVASHPKAAQLCMVEPFAAGGPACERAEQMRKALTRELFSCQPDAGEPRIPPLAARGIVHGIWQLAAAHLQEGQARQLPSLAGELADWALSYRCPPNEFPPPARLLTRCVVPPCCAPAGDERKRLQRAVLQLAGRRGWLSLTRPAVLELAEVDEEPFAALYDDVDDCFLDALDLVALEIVAPMLAAARAEPNWPAGVRAAVAALLQRLNENPVLTRVAFVEALCAGPAGMARLDRLLQGFAGLLERTAPAGSRPSPVVCRAIAAAVWGVLHDYVKAGAVGGFEALAAPIGYLVLTPAIGARAALQEPGRRSVALAGA